MRRGGCRAGPSRRTARGGAAAAERASCHSSRLPPREGCCAEGLRKGLSQEGRALKALGDHGSADDLLPGPRPCSTKLLLSKACSVLL